jgi:ATP-binding cassette subfamily F protein uup
LTGIIEPDTGNVDLGVNTVFGYFTQNKEEFDPDMRVIDYVKNTAEIITLENGSTITAAKMLERFLFAPGQHYTLISNLSGGEKRRLYLLNILMKNPNFIILDEPTNDIDIKTLSVLENFLTSFTGSLLIVTHDRYFMNRVVDHIFVFDDNGNIKSFPGNYSDYLEFESMGSDKSETAKKINKPEPVKNEDTEKTKLTFKEKKELEDLEREIESLENEKKELDFKFSEPDFDHGKSIQWKNRYSEIEKILDEKIIRWEYLASFK